MVNAAGTGLNAGADTSVSLGNTVDVAANAAVNLARPVRRGNQRVASMPVLSPLTSA